jgi:hypothetical protein
VIGLRTSRLIAAGVLATVAVAGCGSNDKKAGAPIPRSDAAALINRLEEVKRRSDPFRCNDLRNDTLKVLSRQVQALPASVDPNVRSTLEDGIAHLSQLVDQECAQQNTQTDTTPSDTTPAPATTTPPQTTPTPTPTTPPPTTPTPTTPTPTTPGNGGATPGTGKPKKGDGTG